MVEIQPIDLNKKTVFVLGARASKPYGLPLGTELKTIMISGININHVNTLAHNKFDNLLADNFAEALKYTSYPTIDIFLEKKSKFREIGAYAIAYTLLPLERTDYLFPQKDWYSHLYNVLDFENNKPNANNIVFVTLNYDRSLEHFLHKNIQYNCPDDLTQHATQKLATLKIIHAHGSLGRYPEINYGESFSVAGILKNAAEGIRITSDRLDDTNDFRDAQAAIRDAFNLVFIGFGYDQTTLKLLINNADLSNKRILGTTYNINDSTINFIHSFFHNKIETTDSGADTYRFVANYLPLGLK